MSNSPISPSSRPLELLKVAELRDELRKRGLSGKGVKKELFERLEEAIKGEQEGVVHVEETTKGEQEGVVHGEPRSRQEGAHPSDGTEDFEDEGEVLDETKSKTHNEFPSDKLLSSCPSDSLPSLCPSDVLLKTPLSTTDEATPISETHALSGVSAPDGVPGFNEDREQHSAAGAASVGSDNDVLFVDNAVCEDGDAMLLPEKVPNVADELEPGKETSGNHETRPEIATSDLKASVNADGAPESGFALNVNGNIVADVISASIENGNAHVAVDNLVSVNNASGSDCAMQDVEKTQLSAGPEVVADQWEILIEVSPSETDCSALMQSTVDSGLPVEEKEVSDLKTEILSIELKNVVETLADSINEEPEKPIADERDMIVNKEKPGVKMDRMETYTGLEEKHEVVNTGQSDVRMEPMEVDAGLEDKPKLTSEGNKERQIDVEDPSQLKFPSKESQLKEVKFENSSCDNSRENRGNESTKVPDECKNNARDTADLKLIEDDQAHINSKRRDTDLKQQEPAKRMRRWNSGKEVTVDALKPSTTDSVKEIILPESTDAAFVAAQRLRPKAVATSTELTPKVKVEPVSGNTRTVPPSTRAPSNSLIIERFVRPFTLKAVKDLLGEFGQCVDFWMDQIKTHCFATYSSMDEAVAARSGLYGRQWPPSVGNFLVAEFVDSNEVKIRSEGLAEKAQAAPSTASLWNANAPPTPPPRVVQSAPSFRSGTLPPSRFSRETQVPPPPKKDPELAGLTLEDLFFKTKEKPSIYYLPLTDKQVAEKLAAGRK